MKYSEAKSRIKDLLESKYGDEWRDRYKIEDDESSFSLLNRYGSSMTFENILMVSKTEDGRFKGENVDPREKGLADIFMELALTPLEKRVEEKKYVVKVWDLADNLSILVRDRVWGLLNIVTTNAVDILTPGYQVAFTKKEIDRLKDTATLNIDWDKAVEEYDGEI
ncbi:hypothetical protein [Limosilactobacillus fermentum]|uniref:hypothetical protein n=1 Tax=Limosilactobacillus fermentum TaxID=1613 RepID=UPI0013635B7F|nr:hypothetical protein [Limosilactobacillus fermentum]MCZ2326548.1 hypothetical protein [Limosilactobacillus fermentum]